MHFIHSKKNEKLKLPERKSSGLPPTQRSFTVTSLTAKEP